MTFRKCRVALACWLFAVNVMAAPVEISGVRLEESIDVGSARLQLNGAGIRYKAIFKVLVAGLYLGKKAATPEEVFAAPGPKRMSLTFLRDVDSQEFSKQFMKGFADNTGADEVAKLAPALDPDEPADRRAEEIPDGGHVDDRLDPRERHGHRPSKASRRASRSGKAS
jgi:hypothetical protein